GAWVETLRSEPDGGVDLAREQPAPGLARRRFYPGASQRREDGVRRRSVEDATLLGHVALGPVETVEAKRVVDSENRNRDARLHRLSSVICVNAEAPGIRHSATIGRLRTYSSHHDQHSNVAQGASVDDRPARARPHLPLADGP